MSFEKETYKSSVHVVIRPNEEASSATSDRLPPYDQRFAQDPPGAPGRRTISPARKFSESSVPPFRVQESGDQRMRSTSVVIPPSGMIREGAPVQSHSPKYARTFSGGEVTMQINLQSANPTGQFNADPPPTTQYYNAPPDLSIQQRATPSGYIPEQNASPYHRTLQTGYHASKHQQPASKAPTIRPYQPENKESNTRDRNQNIYTQVQRPSVSSRLAAFEKRSASSPMLFKDNPQSSPSAPWKPQTEKHVQEVAAPKTDTVEVAKPSQIVLKQPLQPRTIDTKQPTSTTPIKTKSDPVKPKLAATKSHSVDIPSRGSVQDSNGVEKKQQINLPGRKVSQDDVTSRWTGKTNLKPKEKGRRKLTGINSPLSNNFKDLKNVFQDENSNSSVPSFSRKFSQNSDSISEADETKRSYDTQDSSPFSRLQSQSERSITGSSSSLSSDGVLAETVRPKILVPSRRISDRYNGALRDSTPSTRDSTPSTRDSTPSMRDITPSMRDSAPSTRDTTFSMRDTTPSMRDSTPSMRDSTPSTSISAREIQANVPQERLQIVSSKSSSISTESDRESLKESKIADRANENEAENNWQFNADVSDRNATKTSFEEELKREEAPPPPPESTIPEASSFFVDDEEDDFERLRKLRERRFSKTRSSARGRLQMGASFDVQDVLPNKRPVLHKSLSEEPTNIHQDDKPTTTIPVAAAKAAAPAPAPRRSTECAPCFIAKPRRQFAAEGDNVKFRCSAHADPSPTVTWLLNGRDINDDQSHKVYEDNGYYFVEILGVTAADAGTVTCRITNSVGAAESQAQLQVEAHPPLSPQTPKTAKKEDCAPILSEALEDLEIEKEGQLVTLSCSVNGLPEPTIQWFHNDILIATTDCRQRYDGEVARLTLKSFKAKYIGTFRCTATNSAGSVSSTCKVSLKVEEQPPKILEEMSDLTVHDGQPGTLTCKLQATPDTEISWYRNNKVVKASRDFKPSFDGFIAKLEITEVYPEDAGVYVCKAENSKGEASSSARVAVQDVEPEQVHLTSSSANSAPVFTQGLLDCTVDDGAAVEFEIRISGSSPIQIHWFRNGKAIDTNDANFRLSSNGDLHKLIIPKAIASLKGTYVCEACNDYGDEESSCELTVLDELVKASTAPYFIQKPRSLHIEEGTIASLTCQIGGVPSPKVQWQLNGNDLSNSDRVKLTEKGEVFTFEIPHVLSSDAGKYICIASNAAGKEMSTFSIIVKAKKTADVNTSDFRSVLKSRSSAKEASPTPNPPSATKQLDFRNVLKNKAIRKPLCVQSLTNCTVDDGESLLLECKFNATSNTSVLWKCNDQEIKESDSTNSSFDCGLATLSILSATQEHHGTFTCTASNDGGEEITSCEVSVKKGTAAKSDLIPSTTMTSSLLEMEEPPFIEELSPENIHIICGKSFTLTAQFVSSPAPEVKWFRDRVQLSDGGRVHISTSDKQTTVLVENAEGDDTGCYTLQLTNDFGQDRFSSSVTVEDRPEPPVGQPALSNITGTSLVLSWSGPSYDGGSSITYYRVEMTEKNPENWRTLTETCQNTSYEIKDLQPNEEYLFRVSVANRHGFSEPGQISDVAITIDGRNQLECSSAASDLLSPVILSGPLSPLALMSARDEESEEEPLSPFDELPFEPRQVSLDTKRSFTDYYTTGAEIGKGRFGSVFISNEKQSGREFAAKFIKVKSGQRDELRNEVMIMNALHHPKLLLLWDAFETRREMILVLEHVAGGELFERIIDEDYILTERESIHFMRQIVSGVNFMHDNNILHLDLKPENILCISKNSNEIKIIDFGLARKFDPNKSSKVMFGTAEFVAPEVVNYDPISYTTDMWSVGIICYMLLSGLSPFMGENDAETFVNVTLCKWDFDDDIFDDISDDAKDFIEHLLITDPKKRHNTTAALDHCWLSQDVKFMRAKRLSTEKHKRYMAKRKWQKTGNAMRALGRMSILQKTLEGRSTPSSRSRASSVNSDSGSSSNSLDARSRSRTLPNSLLARKAECSSEEAALTEPKFSKEMADLEVTTGQTANFHVTVEGNPEPMITWYKENEPIKGDRRRQVQQHGRGAHSLTISRCVVSDDAEYRCQATSSEGVAVCRADLFVDPEKQS